mmetsp:Transcript_78019/g.114216  ORF Transcript_78019/g.114216 Transcript_78019/m.114216 type:complete len:91 (-) Transcript_78019:28-300(-)
MAAPAKKCTLILQDGTRWSGDAFGAEVSVSGEAVFQTGTPIERSVHPGRCFVRPDTPRLSEQWLRPQRNARSSFKMVRAGLATPSVRRSA